MSVRLAALDPPFSDALLKLLADVGIRTAPDLIFTPPAAILSGLPRGSTSLADLTDAVARVTAQVAAEGASGEQLYAASRAAETEEGGAHMRVASGVRDLDVLLGGSFGGAACPRVIEVAGESGGGKTVRVFPRARMIRIDASLSARHLRCTSCCVTSLHMRRRPRCG